MRLTRRFNACLLACSLLPAAGHALADQVIADDLIVDGSFCAGLECANGESFNTGIFRIKSNVVRLDLIDTGPAGTSVRDWRIEANSQFGTAGYLAFVDTGDTSTGAEGGTGIMLLSAGAPASSIFVASTGQIGLGTATPAANLHIRSGNTPSIKLEQDGSGGNTPLTWRIGGNDTQFFVQSAPNAGPQPLRIFSGAPTGSIVVASTGRVGHGSGSPTAPLEIASTPTTIGTGNAVLKLVNSAGPVALQMVPGNGPLFWNFAAATATAFNINRSGNSTVELALSDTGNLTISGTLTTGGPSCGTGCDAVFDAGYRLPSIDEHAEAMWDKKHLPNVGPTLPSQPVNISEQYGRMLNELETAHIYIDQLHQRIEAQDAGIAQLRAELDLLKSLRAN